MHTIEGEGLREGGRGKVTIAEIWTFSTSADPSVDLTGFKVEALDGSIGKVDESTYEAGGSFVVVDTGPWIFGTKVMIPAGVVRGIDETEKRVFVNRTKEQIKDAPEWDESLADDSYRSDLGTYYGPGGAGYRDWDDGVL